MYAFGETLKKLRNERKISQNALAKQLDLTRATINAWEMGISTPNAQSLIILSKFFKVSVDFLLGLNKREFVDVSELNGTERKMIFDMVSYLSKNRFP